MHGFFYFIMNKGSQSHNETENTSSESTGKFWFWICLYFFIHSLQFTFMLEPFVSVTTCAYPRITFKRQEPATRNFTRKISLPLVECCATKNFWIEFFPCKIFSNLKMENFYLNWKFLNVFIFHKNCVIIKFFPFFTQNKNC